MAPQRSKRGRENQKLKVNPRARHRRAVLSLVSFVAAAVAAAAATVAVADADAHPLVKHTEADWPSAPLLHEIQAHRILVQRYRRADCRPPRRFQHAPSSIPRENRGPVTLNTILLAEHEQMRRPVRGCAHSRAWARTSAARCVSSKEGGLTSVGAGGLYHGKWQADLSFHRSYGGEFLRRWGLASRRPWPEWAQDMMAWRGWSARGWEPWPTTSRKCGLR